MADDTSSSVNSNLDYLAVNDIGAEVIRKAAMYDDAALKYKLRTGLSSESTDDGSDGTGRTVVNVRLDAQTMSELGSVLQSISETMERVEFFLQSIAER